MRGEEVSIKQLLGLEEEQKEEEEGRGNPIPGWMYLSLPTEKGDVLHTLP